MDTTKEKLIPIFKCGSCNIRFSHDLTEVVEHAMCPHCLKKQNEILREELVKIKRQRDALLECIDLKKLLIEVKNV
jgi:hypothetical protein